MDTHLDQKNADEGGSVTLHCPDLKAADALARRLAAELGAGDIILLDGPLAAGKTTFTSVLCKALGSDAQVSSPTYVITNTYKAPDFEIFHIDAYRLSSVQEFQFLGVEEFFPTALTLIEWGSQVREAFQDYLQVEIGFADGGEEARAYTLTGVGPRWHGVIQAFSNAQSGNS
ncbi:tRNA (adenosine(37)-N6)-threonylcarbamoyltransferase complex ATPase subunit type 1 TsaE [Roseibium denhamense]|uniref:tRNA threonylcarbamoyladenosine biosynthesis protein TsaE n=1 Tax=Roseibium denhamense TaxID=76305 RepID=A0ABY1P531_9HYPH|nr:tRNA (adenosine(37)-N6)-threonylcarbamoyltransferase complex ATPase subunit type 1 TsaE [Roseibium denhamense]SMP26729.1 tRNA threonylcarbamoyladenosine biosynthesis protein TsaE [Roseibium denhamense]